MGLLDALFSDDPQKQAMMATALGLLSGSGKTNKNFGADLGNAGLLGLQTYNTAAQQERVNRQNDLQQLSGAYNLLKQQEFGKMLAANRNGQPYTPNPMLPQMEQRISQLTGLGNLSGRFGLSPSTQATQAQVAAPTLPAAQASQYSPVVKPEYQASGPMPQSAPQQNNGGLGGPAGGVPMEAWLAQDPTGKSYLDQLAKDSAPQNVRPGGSLAVKGPDGKYTAAFYSPNLGPGMMPKRDVTSGEVVGAAGIPGYIPAASAITASQAAARAFGGLPYEPPTTVQTKGAPTLMTRSQQIEAATGSLPPNPFVPPEVQTARNSGQLEILRQELAKETDPKNQTAIRTEIAALEGAQRRGQPFTSQKPGLELQDQGAAAAQKELGQQVGGIAADVFKTGAASVQAKRSLAEMSDMAKNYQPGMFQPLKSKMAQYLSQLPGISEDDANKLLKTNSGDIQGLTSAAIAMAGKLTRQTDAQPSQLQFMKTLESMPSAERSAQGFQKIMDYLNSMHDYNIEKMIAQQQWLDNPKNQGDPSGFEAAWAQKAKTLPFVWNQQQAGGGMRRYNPKTGKIE